MQDSSSHIDTIKGVATSLFFTGGGVAISLADIESYLRIASLLIGISISLYVFYHNHIKPRKK